ncbi:hypothetical protein DQW77_17630 [Roseovarius sp. TE539]|nr:hypothetical protein DQW77_17630 [Roseovarius sp. TE539]
MEPRKLYLVRLKLQDKPLKEDWSILMLRFARLTKLLKTVFRQSRLNFKTSVRISWTSKMHLQPALIAYLMNLDVPTS